MSKKDKLMSDSVYDSFLYWLNADIRGSGRVMEDAIERAFRGWLNDHKDEVLEIVASKIKAPRTTT